MYVQSEYSFRIVIENIQGQYRVLPYFFQNGLTPLHVATHYDNEQVALLLLDKGASPHATAKVRLASSPMSCQQSHSHRHTHTHAPACEIGRASCRERV